MQHAHNPVDWYPWSGEALALARESGKPILLSIGYTACHWCHVMEQESFEDHATAAYMNDHFVCIKVDREERPDLDKVYQVTHQLLSQRPGGWPLTIVMDPVHHVPFFAGTYFPDEPRHGMPSFLQVLQRVTEFYREHRGDKLPGHITAMKNAMAQLQGDKTGEAAPGLLERAARELEDTHDAENGGFGAAPKFPHPTNLALCLRLGLDTSLRSGGNVARLTDIAVHSLRAMADGGLFDHVGGGFYRYATDAEWTIPHFEKMLYDNAQLLPVYADAHAALGAPGFRETALRTARWVLAEMTSPEGAYYSSLDADSEGEEGRYYVWSDEELKSILEPGEWAAMEVRYGLSGPANFEGRRHLGLAADLDTVAARTGLAPATAGSLLESAREKLYAARARRVPPLRDEKILTSWNALMARGMAHAGRVLDEPDFIRSAARALDFLHATMWRNGRLRATTRNGVTRLNAYLDDYVFLIDALLEMNQCAWDDARIHWAVALADCVIGHFEDPEAGGLYFTSDDHEALLHRDKPGTDDSTPSGNGIAARVLLRLGHLLADTRYLKAAERILQAFAGMMHRYPAAHGALMEALCEYHEPVETVVVRGDPGEAAGWLDGVTGYRPGRQVFVIPEQTEGALPGIIDDMTIRGGTTAYICRGAACSEPITDRSAFEKHLGGH
jgi:uncharacterized protein YyaL (SSP411 family)